MNEIYESGKLLSEYLLFHFGEDHEILPPEVPWPPGMHEALGFPVRTVSHFCPSGAESGLDLGCAVGRSSFEMARTCDHVTGVDFSHSFVHAAERLRSGEAVAYERLEEAGRHTPLAATMPAGMDPSRLRFLQGDAMHLPADIGSFDRVHAANLLCRLFKPRLLLDRLPSLVRPGGELILATPCTWLAEFTPPQNWPDGDTLGWLVRSLEPAFELVRHLDEPFLIRETARKFQWTRSLVTIWRRNC